jgi:phospholipid/cholesterol/gamma-HCH transport system permease protein
LVVPRVITITLMMVVLCILGDAIALVGAMGTGYLMFDVHPVAFVNGALPLLTAWDFLVGVIKAFLFGGMIALTSCFFGLETTGGAPGVGRSVNASVVAAASGIFISDYLSTFVLD